VICYRFAKDGCQIIETYCDDWCLTEGHVDFSKVEPLLFIMPDASDWQPGDKLANAWHVGKELKHQG